MKVEWLKIHIRFMLKSPNVYDDDTYSPYVISVISLMKLCADILKISQPFEKWLLSLTYIQLFKQ